MPQAIPFVASAVMGAKAKSDQRSAEKRARRDADLQSQAAQRESARREQDILESIRLTGDEKQRQNQAQQRSEMTGEDLLRSTGGISDEVLNLILQEISNPDAAFYSTLDPQLELARQFVNQQANARGVFGGSPEGGIRFEQMGRAAVDLAIKEAQARQADRQRIQENALRVLSGGLGEQQQARSELDALLNNFANRRLQGTTAANQIGANINQTARRDVGNVNDTISLINLGSSEKAANKAGQSLLGSLTSLIPGAEAQAVTQTGDIDSLLSDNSATSVSRLGDFSGRGFTLDDALYNTRKGKQFPGAGGNY